MTGKRSLGWMVVFLLVLAWSDVALAQYHAGVGRFLQRDPAEYVDGANLYEFVRGNPTSLVDPYGLWGADIHQTATTKWAGEARGYDEDRECVTVFSPDQAAAIGAADEAIDHGDTAPINDTSWHFRSKGSLAHEEAAVAAANEDARNKKCDTAITHLGNSLHPLQDSFSHTKAHGAATPTAHVITSGKAKNPFSKVKDPDDAAAWPQDVAAAETATKGRLRLTA